MKHCLSWVLGADTVSSQQVVADLEARMKIRKVQKPATVFTARDGPAWRKTKKEQIYQIL